MHIHLGSIKHRLMKNKQSNYSIQNTSRPFFSNQRLSIRNQTANQTIENYTETPLLLGYVLVKGINPRAKL